ncbi:hypothetical protein PCANC_22897 [Puccinia coronata f. sp. avenae]|uniref:Uncharacterized protein n=1 Tax=Puccinia coronata f. sp. avenae TaxID=200324 RepID=A0A2N5U0J5_9BASI|nr:hypothetical protein PCANC_22897 [Puccinia coronata f. sp. avenae]
MSTNKHVLVMLAAPAYLWLMERLQDVQFEYSLQELIPASCVMIAKLKEYFNPAVKKPIYICSTLLDPRIKATALTDTFLELINMTKQEVVFEIQPQKAQTSRLSSAPAKGSYPVGYRIAESPSRTPIRFAGLPDVAGSAGSGSEP